MPWWACLPVATALSALVAPSGAAQEPGPWATRRAEVTVGLTPKAVRAHVAVRYELVALGAEDRASRAAPIPFELLDFGEVATEEIVVEGRGTLALRPTAGAHRAVLVEPSVRPAAGEAVVLHLRYSVEDAVKVHDDGVILRVRVPVLTGPAVLADAEEPVFRATLDVPPTWSVTEGFPSALHRADPGAGRYVVTLPTIPSMVGFRGRNDGAWHPGFPLLVDIVALLILLIFAGFGWRHLRRVAA
ncbi:MAG: hypothetical protein R3304_08975 [Longimicrobiales bacterium]|nr:hypothetical protein [Longimicrobiales bacterium]